MNQTDFNKCDKEGRGFAACVNFLYWAFAILYQEALLHWVVYRSFNGKFGYAVGFGLVLALALTFVLSFLPKKWNFSLAVAFALFFLILYGSQMVYNFIFGTMYSVALIQQGGAAMKSFWRELLSTMCGKAGYLLLLSLPVVVIFLARKFVKRAFHPLNWGWRCAVALSGVVAYFMTLHCLTIGGTGAFSDYYYYHSSAIATQQTVERFGLPAAFCLELFGSGENQESEEEVYYVVTETAEKEPKGELSEESAEIPTGYHVMNVDLDAIIEMTDDDRVRTISKYCAQLSGTNKNAYTGMLKDYNLIVLCAESFSTAAIHPDVTPTLYKLANEGIIFNNYYNSFPNTTTDGEYALCTGLYPDSARGKQASSMYASRNIYMPFTLGNVFGEQLGIQAYGYHNYEGSYYGREESHPNMGYTMKFANAGMTFSSEWPASDLEMMEQSVDDYIGQEQFHAYYMTFSGHFQYDTRTNAIAEMNWDKVADLDYFYEGKCYLSCNVELDKALAYLLERLEAEGIADKTAIVIAGDHFPYGLTEFQYSDLIGYQIDGLSKFKSTLVFWVGGLEENIVVDEYCCNVDILPTILNLWGLEYDSRMLAGTDVFSDGLHMAVLSNMSFLTDKAWLNSVTGEIRYLVDQSELPEDYVEDMIRVVMTKFTVSSDILNTAYYNVAFGKESAEVDWKEWLGTGR